MRSPAAVLSVVSICLVAAVVAAAEGAEPATAERAVELYDAGRYAEAGEILERLEAEGKLDGGLIYRLYYCRRQANDPRATETLSRSIEPLEREAAGAKTLEPSFYLVNAYQNLGRRAEMLEAARNATRRVETGALDEPATGLERFRLGKLYADSDNPEQAERWFRSAIDSFDLAADASNAAYDRWASGYLADAAFAREDYVAAAQYYGRLVERGEPTTTGLDRLATARARAGLYQEAGKAWRQAELLDPANANRARYCYRLAEAAARLPGVSAAAPDGRLWTQLSADELTRTMQEQAAAVKAVHERIEAAKPLDQEERSRFRTELEQARPVFVAAALEFALQGHNIRETAFFGGYAPLIFHDRSWQVPP
ncbi:MAG TPA: hypothetical protein VD788_17525 [Candidatus Polarisedimenticolaceae bacterium]|nr:hypothetical protein [Candidatus Polarisedimenticolaceae bacterium]